ncbi:MAG: peptide-N-glycosidase F-related protein [Bacteroidales bacterium]|nr:peptide-N-glycosidase F-related protein [Bacteroidales bacterium]
MKTRRLTIGTFSIYITLVFILFQFSCNKKEEPTPGNLQQIGNSLEFGEVGMNAPSIAQEVKISGSNITSELLAEVSGDFEIAVGAENYSTKVSIDPHNANSEVTIKVRCKATKVGGLQGKLTVSGYVTSEASFDLSAIGVEKLHKFTTFNEKHLAFGGGNSQAAIGTFNFPAEQEKIEKITMFVKLDCPIGGCNAWDVFANVKVRNPESDEWMEIGRYITPYGVDNSEVEMGFPIDVTDFKNLLTGEVELRSFIEVWGADGWLLTLDFEIIEGTPDYKYYKVATILDYTRHSLDGIPYGEENEHVVDRCIDIPANAEASLFRTIITGWGHATPSDNDGRTCAEWCFRTHHIIIDDNPLFTHDMNGIGCANNPVQPQSGNWQPDRAGWCPGMAVPVRIDEFPHSRAGESFCYKYQLEEWTNDMQSTAQNKHAYYSISSYMVVKSNTPIDVPVVY